MRQRLSLALVGSALLTGTAMADPNLDSYNVVWTTPSGNASGSMPLGNGEVGLNLWVEEGGDIVFLLSRTDAWSECNRLLKLGRIRVRLTPSPLAAGSRFRQELRLRQGRVDIAEGSARVTVFVEPDRPVVRVRVASPKPIRAEVSLEDWRSSKKVLKGEELMSSWTMHGAPDSVDVWESPDTVKTGPTGIVWYHRNAYSVVPLTLRHQGLESVASTVADPLKDRTFGGLVWGEGFRRSSERSLLSRPSTRLELSVAAHCAQTPNAPDFEAQLQNVRKSSVDPSAAQSETSRWWGSFWERSWVFIEGDQSDRVTVNHHPLRIGADSSGGSAFEGLAKVVEVLRGVRPPGALDFSIGGPDYPQGVEPVVHVYCDGSGAVVSTRASDTRQAWDTDEDQGTLPAYFDPGFPQRSLRFSGRGLDALPRIDLSSGFTLTALVRPTRLGGRLVDNISPGGSDGFLFDTYGGRLRLIVGNRTLVGPPLVAGAWQKLSATYDGRTGHLALYVNDKVVAKSPGGLESTPSRVTQAYVLQRWMSACAGRGNAPIKFNGSIFTVDPKFTGGPDFDPDWRRWGDCYWWQNTRFPYAAMVANGDTDMMRPLFRTFEAAVPLCRARARLYHGVDAVYFPETMTVFGAYSNGDYGWDRSGHAANEVLCPWWQYAWQQGLELVGLMLDYQSQTGDREFQRDELLPMARGVLAWYDQRFMRDDKGRIVISPTQAVETYWTGVVNDTPSVAGLHDVVRRLLELPGLAQADRALFSRLLGEAPAVPVKDGRIEPAERYDPKRSNVENPELYALWPFRVYGLGRPGLRVAQDTFRARQVKDNHGWQYDGQCAAIAGLGDDAKESLLEKARNANPAHRFPAMWGPNYDWLPDQDHGSNLMLTVQNMLLQCVDDKIYVLPAWPKEWDASFKLHARRRTTVTCTYRNGRIVDLKVSPPSRRKDVVLPPG